MNLTIIQAAAELFKNLERMPLETKVETINKLRLELAKYSPFNTEPVDCVQWVKNTEVQANDYNPNTVAPPEMKLLELSIQEDGYTQPIVSWSRDGIYEVIDGFHRHRVGKESKPIQKRVNGYLPLVVINSNRTDIGDRMASTIRHNRARGKHGVDSMSDIVVELKKRNRSEDWIAKHLGMDADEVTNPGVYILGVGPMEMTVLIHNINLFGTEACVEHESGLKLPASRDKLQKLTNSGMLTYIGQL